MDRTERKPPDETQNVLTRRSTKYYECHGDQFKVDKLGGNRSTQERNEECMQNILSGV